MDRSDLMQAADATLTQAFKAMNDEQLFFIEKKVSEERARRDWAALNPSADRPGDVLVIIDLTPMINAVRANWRQQMSLCSEAALASVLDQVSDHCEETEDEKIVTELLRQALTAVVVLEARCEGARRSDSIR